MDFETVQATASLLGYIALVVGAAVIGAAGLAFLTDALSGRINKAAAECIMSDDPYDPPRCHTHGCSPDDPCGLLACPHCRYKSDYVQGVYGYPLEGSDPRNPANYPMERLIDPEVRDVFGAPSARRDAAALSSQDCHPDCDPEDPEDRKVFRVRFVDPMTMDFDSDVEGLREVREHLSNGDVIHYVRGETEHVDRKRQHVQPSDDYPFCPACEEERRGWGECTPCGEKHSRGDCLVAEADDECGGVETP